MQNNQFQLIVEPDGFVYQKPGQQEVILGWPSFEIDGNSTRNTGLSWRAISETLLPNGVTEYRYSASIADGIGLALVARVAPDSAIVRFRYELSCSPAARFGKLRDSNALTYATISFTAYPDVTEVRLSEWVEIHHTYISNEVNIPARSFTNRLRVMGPLLVGETPGQSVLLAYEHGSTYPDAFLTFALAEDRQVTLQAAKGNYCAGQAADGFCTVWMLLGSVDGNKEQMATELRQFLLRRQALNNESRKPYIFYNTWNFQERNKSWYGKPYLGDMNQERMHKEIEVAHQMGIEVFVIDAGWFQRSGDWQANLERFPDGLQSIKQQLDRYGMKLGLWFDNSAGVASHVLKEYLDCRCSSAGKVWDTHVIWETEAAHGMCLVSRYWEAFARELIRLYHEVGVTYFKWDAIGQYGCTDPHHLHGTAENSEEERGDNYAFQLPLFMARIVDTIARECPQAIVDFDVTETHRAVGLAFLSAGKFFLINNGPYYWNYDVPKEAGWANENPNIFFFPGPARTWICRQPLTYDKWVPMNLFLTHYLPDDGAANQVNCVASLILGQNGIWGDLPAISAEGIERFGKLLELYKRVRHDIAAAPPVREGLIGGCPEIHEKINPATGKGAVVIFATNHGQYQYITQQVVHEANWATAGTQVTRLPDGRASITATFTEKQSWEAKTAEWAKIVYFGV